MVKSERFLPTRPSKVRCVFLIGAVICLYMLENSSIKSIINGQIFNYVIKPALWLGLAYIVWTLPRVRVKGKIKLRGFLNLWSFNFAIMFVIVSVLVGLVDGLGKSPYSHSPIGIMMNIVFVGSALIGREFVRSYLVNDLSKEENYLVFILTALFMTVVSISLNKFTDVTEYAGLVKFIAQDFAPEFCHNLFATYLAFLGGPVPAIIYFGILKGFHWLSPILPDLKWITKALIGILCPIFSLMTIQSLYLDASKGIKKKDKDEESPISWMITSIVSIAIIWFAVGVFPIYPSVVATGSMEPMIKPGDVILVKKVDGNDVKVGDVVQFKRDSILISHRVMEIKEEEQGKGYRTKGDNNSAFDTELVKPEQVKGIIIHVVPKIGWPSLLIKSDKDIPLEEIVF